MGEKREDGRGLSDMGDLCPVAEVAVAPLHAGGANHVCGYHPSISCQRYPCPLMGMLALAVVARSAVLRRKWLQILSKLEIKRIWCFSQFAVEASGARQGMLRLISIVTAL